MRKYFVYLIVLAIVTACSGIQLITKGQYSDEFLKKVEDIKVIYKQGNNQQALQHLNSINDAGLNPSERAMKYNLIGVIYFSEFNYQFSIKNFNEALKTADSDSNLKAQIKLNMASSYFKMSNYRVAFQYIEDINYKALNEKEAKKHHHLSYILAQQLNNTPVAAKALILLTSNAKNFQDFRNSPFSESLMDNFSKLNTSQKMRMLEEFEREKLVNVAFLGKMEAENQYYSGNKGEAGDIIAWLGMNYAHIEEVKEFVDDFTFRMENYSKINPNAVGVILPLTGKKSTYGKKALKGIDAALSDIVKTQNEKKGLKLVKPVIYTKDNHDSTIAGVMAVRELVEKHFVSVIVGGLFSSSAKEEYLEAKKYGVVYISLSPIYLPKDEKNHLLIEVPGSVESQVATALSPDMIQKFGKKVAILYPESEGGLAYVDEMWRHAKANRIELTSIHNYEKNITDYRDSVEKLLGLKFKRERKEEYEIWSDIYKLEGKRSVRRIQTLKPIVDFDWVFLPAFPHEAIQIVPAFNYYDALGINFVGGPSWRSKTLIKEQRELGNIHFIGDNPDYMDPNFRSRYFRRYGKSPRLIETLAYDGLNVGFTIISEMQIQARDQLELSLKNRKTIKGLTGLWYMDDGVWLKDMAPLSVTGGKIVKIVSEEKPKEVTQ
jgi:outer membrane PBP1 activator LpoA protein